MQTQQQQFQKSFYVTTITPPGGEAFHRYQSNSCDTVVVVLLCAQYVRRNYLYSLSITTISNGIL